ncbi:cryptochrome/photolyase family protein [Actibacterium atlanticum]|uniref:cryptochrome/photolyase family protein n=1 Tax=Actibacterium atlanticum TaxID=1461693 RepID=UPI000691204C|nr:deoxyribodipyrimidine photo-lyase [Actibacterium atlanticum]
MTGTRCLGAWVNKVLAVIVWLRRDLRLADHAALTAACKSGGPVIPVYILDSYVEDMGAAPRFRLEQALAEFARTLDGVGSRLILRRGEALDVLRALVKETGACRVFWSRDLSSTSIDRDRAVKLALRQSGVEARSFVGNLLFEPWDVQTGSGGAYKVFTPFWRAVRGRDVQPPRLPPAVLPTPVRWPRSDRLEDWNLSADMQRGRAVVGAQMQVGEASAQARLQAFLQNDMAVYNDRRDELAGWGGSDLSQYLAWGEISPATIWHAVQPALHEGTRGAEAFLRQLAWRDFAWHLMFHSPSINRENWRDGWQDFPWNTDAERPEVIAWKRGQTGIDLVDAAMREMYVTGRMHNRARMIAASYLTKHLLTDWRIGMRWFEDCLIDWDPAANAMGWQWVAGCGPDAAPYFRVFNPDTQAEKFDASGAYRQKWLAPDSGFYQAVPRSWNLSPDAPRPAPVVTLPDGRARALAAYDSFRGKNG